MFNLDTHDIQRLTVSAIGAVMLSSVCLMAAVGPAQAAPATVDDWRAEVSAQIDDTLRFPHAALPRDDHAVATVRVRLNAEGEAQQVAIAKSSGDYRLDKEAIRVAERVQYPTLPSGLRGRPQTVEFQLYFGKAADGATAMRHRKTAEAMAHAASDTADNLQAATDAVLQPAG